LHWYESVWAGAEAVRWRITIVRLALAPVREWVR